MAAIDDVIKYTENNRDKFEEELFELLRFPSISSDPDSTEEMNRCAEWLKKNFESFGLSAEILPTQGWPVVVAETAKKSDRPTVLVYGHYDVQPVDPLELWNSPPFEPRRAENGNVYARGATDDKGQAFTHVKAAEAWMKAGVEPPVNLVFLIEGEEEIGSPNLEDFIREHRERFLADAVLISDTSQFGRDLPALCYALRGITYMEFIVTGAKEDLHSGMFGGIAPNPAHVVARILADMKDPNGTIQIPGFYDGVKAPEDWELEEYEKLPWDFEELAKQLGISKLSGEREYPVPVRKWCRPTLDINGVYGGFAGKGAKTVIPSKAGAKVSMRLVPGQDAERVAKLFEDFVRERIPEEYQVELINYQNSPATVIPVEHPAMQAGKEAFAKGFGKEPLLTREGASIPVVSFFVDEMKCPTVLLGFGLPDDNLHAPNEKFLLEDFHRGIKTSAHFLDAFARIEK
ncbi:MAG: dipeptidase [Candidatus Omnitrophica bacterium]|nr:dipeptidase [Candidatus Omnitrophota bacterium]